MLVSVLDGVLLGLVIDFLKVFVLCEARVVAVMSTLKQKLFIHKLFIDNQLKIIVT